MSAPTTAAVLASDMVDPAITRLQHFVARDFRNLAEVVLDVPAPGMALVGNNGHGKTNLLEAVYYLHLFRSLRGARDAELVRFGAGGFHVRATAAGTRWDRMSAGFDRASGRRRIVLDGVVCERVSDALGALPSVAFAPADVQLVAGGPSVRRRWLDVTLASTSPHYLAVLRDYRTALSQRNAALRSRTRGAAVSVWDRPLAVAGAQLVTQRASFLAWARPHVRESSIALGERGAVDLRYRTGVGVLPDAGVADLRDALAAVLAADVARDSERGVTHHGPHRDDVDLRLDGMSLRRFGSAGQQRTAAVALRLVECAWHRQRAGREPILLLDDPVAELDRDRAERVLALLTSRADGQVLLAVPREDDIPEALTSLTRRRIRDGVIDPSHA